LLLLGAHLGRSAGDPQWIERVSMAFSCARPTKRETHNGQRLGSWLIPER
jgi:hypothetical protein